MKNTFFENFPAPYFLELPFVGMSLSNTSVRFVELKRVEDSFVLKKYGEKQLPDEALRFGEIANKKSLVDTLAEIQKENNFKFVRVALPEERVYLFKTTVPTTEDGEIRQAIEFKLEENVPISPDEAVFDFTIVGKDEISQSTSVSVAVIPKKVVEGYAEAFREANFAPVIFEIEGNAIANSLIREKDETTSLVVNFGKIRTLISVVSGHVVQFTSVIAIGGEMVTNLIEKHMSVDRKEAISIKNSHTFFDKKDGSALQKEIVEIMSQLKEEIKKVEIYWRTHDRSLKKDTDSSQISKIILCGRNSATLFLDQYLSRNMDIPAHLADVWTNLPKIKEDVPVMPYLDSLNYTAAIGVALPKDSF